MKRKTEYNIVYAYRNSYFHYIALLTSVKNGLSMKCCDSLYCKELTSTL